MEIINLNIDPTHQWDKLTMAQFEIKFKQNYEVLERNLDGVFTEYHNVDGHSITVPIMNFIQLTNRGDFSTILPEVKAKTSRVSFNLKEKAGLCPIDIVLEKEIKANIVSALSEQAVGATKRTEDQFVLDALNTDKENMNAVGQNTSLFSLENLIDAKVKLDDMGIPSNDRHFVGSVMLKKVLLKNDKLTSVDFNTVRALVSGEMNDFLGFRFHWIPKMPEGGIEEGSAYVFQKNDGAQAWGLSTRMEMGYHQTVSSNILTMIVHGNAKVLSPDRMVHINYKH